MRITCYIFLQSFCSKALMGKWLRSASTPERALSGISLKEGSREGTSDGLGFWSAKSRNVRSAAYF